MTEWVISRVSKEEILSLELGCPRQGCVSSRAAGSTACSPIFSCSHDRPGWRLNSSGQTLSVCDKFDKINDFSRQRKCKISHLSGPKMPFDIVPHGKLSAQLKAPRIYTGAVKWEQRWLKGSTWQGAQKGNYHSEVRLPANIPEDQDWIWAYFIAALTLEGSDESGNDTRSSRDGRCILNANQDGAVTWGLTLTTEAIEKG